MNADEVLTVLRDAGITDVPWLPDSDIGRWESALAGAGTPRLIRVCREGEALAIAAGLLLGGRSPLVMIQCTGLFEAGDTLRNVVHDMRLPVRVLVGVRSWNARATSPDTCPKFTPAIVEAWGIPYRWLDGTIADFADALRKPGPLLLLMPE